MKSKFSNFFWGLFLLVAAAFVLTNNHFGFADIGVGRLILAFLALAFIVQCLANRHFAPLVIPLAVLYVIFRRDLGLPPIQTWKLVTAAVLAFIGLNMLLPGRRNFRNHFSGPDGEQKQIPEEGDNDNNPYVSVNFGSVSRSLRAAGLETARLSCNFGAMEIYFNQVELSPGGAEVNISCSFGGVLLFVPKHWHVIDKMNCTLAGVNLKSFAPPVENAPRLTLTGSVSLGGVDVKYI